MTGATISREHRVSGAGRGTPGMLSLCRLVALTFVALTLVACRSGVVRTEGRFDGPPGHPRLALRGTIDPKLALDLRIEYQSTRWEARCSGWEGETGRVYTRVLQRFPRLTGGAYAVELPLDPADVAPCAPRIDVLAHVIGTDGRPDSQTWDTLATIAIDATPTCDPSTAAARSIVCSPNDATRGIALACFLTSTDASGRRCHAMPIETIACGTSCSVHLDVRDAGRPNLTLREIAPEACGH